LTTADNFAADIALIELALDIVENDSTKIVPLATTEPAAGTNAVVSGWGAVAVRTIFFFKLMRNEKPIG